MEKPTVTSDKEAAHRFRLAQAVNVARLIRAGKLPHDPPSPTAEDFAEADRQYDAKK